MDAAVVDASAFVACVLPDESAPDSLMKKLRSTEFVVPGLWLTEVANTLLIAERRGRIGRGDFDRIVNGIRQRPLVIDRPDVGLTFDTVSNDARHFRLTAYDATYLELAQRRRLPLATLDAALRAAARGARVELV